MDGHVLQGKFNGEVAVVEACTVMYLAASILRKEPFRKDLQIEKYIDENINGSKYKKLSYVKKQKLEAYAYLVEAVHLLEE